MYFSSYSSSISTNGTYSILHATRERDEHLLIIMNIHNRLTPFWRGHLALEQDVDFAVGAALHLGEVEEGHDEAEEACSGPDVAAFAAEVAGLDGFVSFCIFL